MVWADEYAKAALNIFRAQRIATEASLIAVFRLWERNEFVNQIVCQKLEEIDIFDYIKQQIDS